MPESLQIPEGTSPSARTRRNAAMARWLMFAGVATAVVGVAILDRTPVVLLMAPVLLLGSAVYAWMGHASKSQG